MPRESSLDGYLQYLKLAGEILGALFSEDVLIVVLTTEDVVVLFSWTYKSVVAAPIG